MEMTRAELEGKVAAAALAAVESVFAAPPAEQEEEVPVNEEEEATSEAAPAEENEREAKLKALIQAKLPEGVDVEEELASVYKSPSSGEYVYREAPTAPPPTPSGIKPPSGSKAPAVPASRAKYASDLISIPDFSEE